MEGTPFGRYRLIELLGRGGMGEVWKAFDTATQRVVAVKVLPAQLAADPIFEQRFRREAYAAAGLNNPHVVPIHNFGEIEGRLYVDMRLIEGQDLNDVLANGPLDPARAVKIIEQVASALNAAHKIGLVHRDVKPSNIRVAEDDFAYLIDFGIARGAGETGLTATGNVVGTWPYMAPERFTTGQNDTRSDIYALACVLYECLTSSRPFPGDSVEQQIAGHLTAPPPRPSITQPGVSPELDTVIATGMAKEPDGRYDTTIELARAARAAVTHITTSAPTQARPAEDGHDQWAATQARTPDDVVKASAPTQAGPTEDTHEPWAQTQVRPAEDTGEPWAPTQVRPAKETEKASTPSEERPDDRTETATEPWPWWQRRAIVIPIAATLMVAAFVTILVALSGSNPNPKPGGPLDGTYAVDFAAQTAPNGQPYDNAPGGRETWVIESACPTGGCVATATKTSGSQSTMSTMVLDEIGGRWTAVSSVPGTCQNAQSELWESMFLQLRPDGKLDGEFVVRSTAGCVHNQKITFTRTGDVQSNVSIADPKVQPPRMKSPAQGLQGQYQETDRYADGRSAEANFAIQTYCLRTGDRCLSYWQNPDDDKTLVFAQSKWVLANSSGEAKCTSGAPAQREVTLEYPLPQPPQDPITLLTGHGHYTVTGDCPFDSDFDSRVARTGR